MVAAVVVSGDRSSASWTASTGGWCSVREHGDITESRIPFVGAERRFNVGEWFGRRESVDRDANVSGKWDWDDDAVDRGGAGTADIDSRLGAFSWCDANDALTPSRPALAGPELG